ncbi:MAG TPA: maleylpyruvate isomerase family mycothiol-dependent enzyme [Mycobacteriales bacterium]
MEISEHLAALTAEGELLARAAERADHEAAVPGCPAWRVGDVVRHTGQVHRWAAAAVRTGSSNAAVYPDDDGAGLTGADLVDWFRAGHAALVATLAAADPGVKAFTFLPAPSPLAFWARRQTHETGIHRADVESGSGPITPFGVAEAVDGVDELLGGFAARPSKKPAGGPGRTLGVLPTDADAGWLVRLGTPPERDPAAAAGADCVLRGTASDLHLLLWNRPAGPVDASGDPAVLADWRKQVRVRWSGPGPRRGR